MKRVITFSVLGIAALTAACSPRAASIQPVPMGNAYSTLSCNEAVMMLNAERQNVATLSSAQNNAATGDAIGVFLIGVPVSNLTGGNKAGDLGAAKGKVIALEQRVLSCQRQQASATGY